MATSWLKPVWVTFIVNLLRWSQIYWESFHCYDPSGDITFTLAAFWNYTCRFCQCEQFYPHEAVQMCLLTFPHMWKVVASMYRHVRCQSGHMWPGLAYVDNKACVCFSNVSYLTGVICNLCLARGWAMARAFKLWCCHIIAVSFKAFRHGSGGTSTTYPTIISSLSKKGDMLCNISERFMENLQQFPVLLLILSAVGLEPLWSGWEQSARGCHLGWKICNSPGYTAVC